MGHGGPGPSGRTPPPFGGPGQGPVARASPPSKPSFGLPLSRLYERDGLAVPMVVYQCIQAVDLFGLGLEGIYRQSGSMAHIQKLKNMFDTGMNTVLLDQCHITNPVIESSNPALDFRNPENFYHDVNSVTGLLKQFFRDLPDPLLTNEHHDSFIAAASTCPLSISSLESPSNRHQQSMKMTLSAVTPSTPSLTAFPIPTTPLFGHSPSISTVSWTILTSTV